MIRFFKTLQPATLIIIPVIILIFWIRAIFHSMPVSDPNQLPVWNAIIFMLSGFPSWINFILLFALVSWQAIYLNLILNRYEVLYKNTFVPAFIYALFISCTPALFQFHPVYLVNLLVLMLIDRAFSLHKNETPASGLFDSGFLAGISALIYFPAVILLPLILTVLGFLRPFKIREWFIMVIGFFLPFLFVSTYMFWNHQLVGFVVSYAEHFRNIKLQIAIEKNINLIVLAIYMGTILLLALLKLRINFRKNVIRTRSFQELFFIYLIFGLVWLVLSGPIAIIHFPFLLVPASVFCSYYFMSGKRKPWLYEYILWLLVVLIVWNHIA